MRKLLVPVIYLRDGKAVSGFGSETVISELPVEELAADFPTEGRMNCWFWIFRRVMQSMTRRSAP